MIHHFHVTSHRILWKALDLISDFIDIVLILYFLGTKNLILARKSRYKNITINALLELIKINVFRGWGKTYFIMKPKIRSVPRIRFQEFVACFIEIVAWLVHRLHLQLPCTQSSCFFSSSSEDWLVRWMMWRDVMSSRICAVLLALFSYHAREKFYAQDARGSLRLSPRVVGCQLNEN